MGCLPLDGNAPITANGTGKWVSIERGKYYIQVTGLIGDGTLTLETKSLLNPSVALPFSPNGSIYELTSNENGTAVEVGIGEEVRYKFEGLTTSASFRLSLNSL